MQIAGKFYVDVGCRLAQPDSNDGRARQQVCRLLRGIHGSRKSEPLAMILARENYVAPTNDTPQALYGHLLMGAEEEGAPQGRFQHVYRRNLAADHPRKVDRAVTNRLRINDLAHVRGMTPNGPTCGRHGWQVRGRGHPCAGRVRGGCWLALKRLETTESCPFHQL